MKKATNQIRSDYIEVLKNDYYKNHFILYLNFLETDGQQGYV